MKLFLVRRVTGQWKVWIVCEGASGFCLVGLVLLLNVLEYVAQAWASVHLLKAFESAYEPCYDQAPLNDAFGGLQSLLLMS